MGDRRIGDRREKKRGEITLKFQDAVIYLILAIFIIGSVSANIILAIRNKQYKEAIEYYESDYEDYYDYEDEILDDNEINSQVSNELENVN